MAGNGNRVVALDAQRMTAMSQGDVGTLNALIADELVYTHSSARLDTKKSLIENMQTGKTVYTAVVPSDVQAQDYGDTVVLTGNARISVKSGDNAMNFGVRFTDVWANKGGNWQMVAWQSTKTPD
ncbi:MAG: nuclear transport factor 2 family protein [Alphaproteobacteria bacterium]